MGLSEIEKNKLKVFSNLTLDRNQIEELLGRKISNNEWRQIQNKPRRKRNRSKQSKYFKTFWKSADGSDVNTLNNTERAQSVRTNRYKKMYKSVAQDAADTSLKRQFKTKIEDQKDKFHSVKSFFKNSEHRDLNIIRLSKYYSSKYQTRVTEWKIRGSVDLFNIQNAITELINRMTENINLNSKIQVSLKITNSDKQPHTPLLLKSQITDLLTEWVNYFIGYHDINIDNITFKLTTIELPHGTGRKVNTIINLDDKRSITQISNKDTICLVRAVIVAFSYHKDKLQEIFKEKLTPTELKDIDYRRQLKTEINEGVISPNEIKYIQQGGTKKLQTVLSKAFHRIYSIPIKDSGNDFIDVKLIEEKLDIEIQIYSMDTRQIYAGRSKPVKIFLLYSNNHYDVISNFQHLLDQMQELGKLTKSLNVKHARIQNPRIQV